MSQQLAEHYTVYIINLRGAGSSDGPTKDHTYSMNDAVKDMEAMREALGIGHWAFAGHSTGGFLALKYSVYVSGESHKDHCRRIVCIR